jgi:hypothetical protein
MTLVLKGGSGTSGTLTGGTDGVIAEDTGALTVPSGTTAQRPSTPVNGMFRLNSTTGNVEVYNGSWQTIVSPSYSATYTRTTRSHSP